MKFFKGIFLFVLIGTILSVLFYHKQLEERLVEWSLQKYSTSYLGTEISYDSIKRKDHNTLIFNFPRLAVDMGKLEGNALKVNYQLGLHGVEFSAQLEGGVFRFGDTSVPITFSGTNHQVESAIIGMNFNNNPINTNALKNISHDWKVQQGVVSGEVLLTLTKDNATTLSGALNFKRLHLIHLTTGLHIKGKQARALFEKNGDQVGEMALEGLSFSLSPHEERDIFVEILHRDLKNRSFNGQAVFKPLRHGILIEGLIPLQDDHSLAFDAHLTRHGLEQVWFEAKDLNFENYAVDAFPNQTFNVSGRSSINGELHHGQVKGEFCFQNVLIENEYLSLAFPEIITPLISKNFSFEGASLFLKNTDLKIDDVKGNVSVSPESVELKDLESTAQGVSIAGDVSIDTYEHSKGRLEVHVTQHSLNGTLSDCCNILDKMGIHLSTSDIPFDGHVVLNGDTTQAHFTLSPDISNVKYFVEGTLTDGSYTFKNKGFACHDISCHFTYDHRHAFHLDEIQGAVQLDDQDYYLAGEGVHSNNIAEGKAAFDFWIGTRQRDMIRFAGNALRLENGHMHFTFDPEQTHIGAIYPEIPILELSDWTTVHKVQMHCPLSLEQDTEDIRRLAKSHLFDFSKTIAEGLDDIHQASGNIDLTILFDDHTFKHQVEGQQVKINDFDIDHLVFNGQYNNKIWDIENCTMGDLNINTRLDLNNNSYAFENFEMHYKNILLMGSEGTYDPTSNHLNLNLSYAQIEFDELASLPTFEELAQRFHPKGTLKATGNMSLDFQKGTRGWIAETSLDASIYDFEFNDIAFQDCEDLTCHWHSQEGFTLHDFVTSFKDNEAITINIDEAGYQPTTQTIWTKGLHFMIPSEDLSSLEELSDILTPQLLTHLEQCKTETPLQGTLNIEASPAYTSTNFTLDDDQYVFNGQEYALRNITASCHPGAVTFECEGDIYGHWTPLEIFSPSTQLTEGTLSIADDEQNQVVLSWENEPEGEYSIGSVEGTFAGLEIALEKGTEPKTLSGSLSGMVGKLGLLFSEAPWTPVINNLQLGTGYTLTGTWSYNDDLQFEGDLLGDHLQIKGYAIESLSSNLSLQNDNIHFHDVKVFDPTGVIEIPEIAFTLNDNDDWDFMIPEVLATNVKPKYLHRVGKESKHSKKAFVIKDFELYDFSGTLNDQDSYLAKGNFTFANGKKNIPDSLLTQETTKHVGLDIPTLTPTSGTVFFEINEEKIHIAKLKDVYSDNHLIKFYLPKGTSSYIDFDGNLNLSLSMQPYNLLFKMEEFFTIAIEGTLLQPTYAFR